MKKKVNEVELSMDMDTLNKVRGKLKPTDKVDLTDKSIPKTPISQAPISQTSVSEDDAPQTTVKPEAVIEPQDSATIKYLSNVKDDNGEVSKPFTIGSKNYQMVRGITPSKEIVMGVYCHDDVNEKGENLIHDIKTFEENIANPAKAQMETQMPIIKKEETIQPKKETKPESLKLSEFKHFIIDKNTGKVRKFKKIEELAKANMSETEMYMNLPQFKKHVDETLFGAKKRKTVTEDDIYTQIRPDVTKAIEQMVEKIKPYMNKVNEPVEKIQFLVKMAQMLQLQPAQYPILIEQLKKASNAGFGGSSAPGDIPSTPTTSTSTNVGGTYESKILTKNELNESLGVKKTIRIVKVKNIK